MTKRTWELLFSAVMGAVGVAAAVYTAVLARSGQE